MSGNTDDLRKEERCEVRVSFLVIAARFACDATSDSLDPLYSIMFTIFFTRVGVKFVKVEI